MRKTQLQLSDAQQAAILRAGYALEPPARAALRERVLEKLEAEPELGDGLVFRVCRTLQPQYFTPPPDEVGHLNRNAQQLRKLR